MPGLALDAAARDEEIEVAVRVGVEPQRGEVLAPAIDDPGAGAAPREAPVTVVEEEDPRPPGRAADEEVVVPVAVGVTPSGWNLTLGAHDLQRR